MASYVIVDLYLGEGGKLTKFCVGLQFSRKAAEGWCNRFMLEARKQDLLSLADVCEKKPEEGFEELSGARANPAVYLASLIGDYYRRTGQRRRRESHDPGD